MLLRKLYRLSKPQLPKSLRIPAQNRLLHRNRVTAEVILHPPMARPYEAATAQTGQSDPIISRCCPKASMATTR